MESSFKIVVLVAGMSLSSVFIFLVYRLVWVPYSWVRFFRKQGIPGEPFVPIVGQLPALWRARENCTDDYWAYETSLAEKHGPVFYLCKGPEFRLCFHDASVYRQVTSQHAAIGKLPVAKEASAITLLQDSLVLSNHDDWKRQRKQYNPAFQHSNLETMFRSMQDCCQDAMESWLTINDDDAARKEATNTINMSRELSKLTFDIIVTTTFGVRRSDCKEMEHTTDRILSVVDIVQRHFFSGLAFIPGTSWLLSKLNWQVREFHTAGRALLQKAMVDYRRPKHEQENHEHKRKVDLLDVLSTHAAENADEALSNAMLLLFAGHETTANTMNFVLYLLDKHPQWWNAVRKEIFAVCGVDQLPSMTQAWKELPICSAVIAETLRLFPIFPELARCAVSPLTISCQGRQIEMPVGTPFVASIVAGHRDPKVWDKPDVFDPTRFLREDVAIPDSYTPFSRGGRNCLGKYFAQLESRLILATIAQRMHIKVAPTYQHDPIYSITVKPKHGLFMKTRGLTTEEVLHWTNQPITTEKQRIFEALAIPDGPPVFGNTSNSVSPDESRAQENEIADNKTSKRSDYGIRTPWILRFAAILCYAETARRGAILLIFAKGDYQFGERDACIGLWLYTLVYGVETFTAIFFRWISLQGVHLQHMYEHHLPGFGLGAALSVYVFLHPESWDVLLLDLCYMPLSLGFLTQLCEVWSGLRTFMPNPDHVGCKVVQRALGVALVSALPMTILNAFHRYVTEHFSTLGGVSWSEAGIVLLSMYLACLVHPSYVLSHLRALEKLVVSGKKI